MNVKIQCHNILNFTSYWYPLKQIDCVTDDSIIALIKIFHVFNFLTAPIPPSHSTKSWTVIFFIVSGEIIIEFVMISWGVPAHLQAPDW